MSGGGIDAELNCVKNFLSRNFPDVFTKRDGIIDLEVSNGFDLVVLASWLPESILLHGEGDAQQEVAIRLERGLTSIWMRDTMQYDHRLFSGRKFIKFFPHVNEAGYASSSYMRKRHKETLARAISETKSQGLDPQDVLFIPYNWYSKEGWQLAESIYAYMASLALRESGFIVFKQYQIDTKIPDVVAFSGEGFEELQEYLRKRGLAEGALAEELQSISSVKMTGSEALRNLIKGSGVVCEVKTAGSAHLGSDQVVTYKGVIPGLFDRAYVCAPFIGDSDRVVGAITFKESGELDVFEPEPLKIDVGDYWRTTIKQERDRVILDAKTELLKNLGLAEILQLLGTSLKATWTELVNAMSRLSFNQILHEIGHKGA